MLFGRLSGTLGYSIALVHSPSMPPYIYELVTLQIAYFLSCIYDAALLVKIASFLVRAKLGK